MAKPIIPFGLGNTLNKMNNTLGKMTAKENVAKFSDEKVLRLVSFGFGEVGFDEMSKPYFDYIVSGGLAAEPPYPCWTYDNVIALISDKASALFMEDPR